MRKILPLVLALTTALAPLASSADLNPPAAQTPPPSAPPAAPPAAPAANAAPVKLQEADFKGNSVLWSDYFMKWAKITDPAGLNALNQHYLKKIAAASAAPVKNGPAPLAEADFKGNTDLWLEYFKKWATTSNAERRALNAQYRAKIAAATNGAKPKIQKAAAYTKAPPPLPAKVGAAKLTQNDFKSAPGLWAGYEKHWNEAADDRGRAAVNTHYLTKLNGGPVTNQPNPPAGPRPDFTNTTTAAQFDALDPAAQNALCAMIGNSGSTGGVDACGDILANADSAMKDCSSQPVEGGARGACLAKINACKSGPPTPPEPIPATVKPTAAIIAKCAMQTGTTPSGTYTPDIGSRDVPSPTDSEHTKAGGMDYHIGANMTNAIPFAVAGLVLGTFFGGPIVWAAFAITAGIAAYALSTVYNKPSPKDDSK